ncbi:hypothetical protein EVAR_72338_1 [Eumeta japonica]|uniref:Uncharacterized protein n=1 Tax=Eumeta variegata TaxID=151549 RepID=A0A4C1SXC1_EUMVA|nr:hypothetical protein EVAR_72338_1 [Eumeta japonica]
MALGNRRPLRFNPRAPGPTWVYHGLTPVSLWALLEWTFISCTRGIKDEKIFENTQEEDERNKGKLPIKHRAIEAQKRRTDEGVFEILQKLETQEQGERQKTSQRSPAKRTPPPRTNDVTTDTNTEMELETDADTESTAQDNREVRKAKRKIPLLRMEQHALRS